MSEASARLRRLQRRLDREGVDALYVSALPNIAYLTGFRGSAGHLLVPTTGPGTLFTDGRYRVQAAQEAPEAELVVAETDPLGALLGSLPGRGIRRMAFEADRLSHAAWSRLCAGAPETSLTQALGWVERERWVKSAAEIEAIRQAAELAAASLDAVLGRLDAQWSEQRLAAEIDHEMRLRGASGPAFETIVAGGAHGALPHARPRPTPLPRRELIVIDHGAILGGYVSDQTRVISLGDPGPRARDLAQAVQAAQQAAMAAIRAGVAAKTVDRAARESLKEQGLDSLFIHSTGHGLGLEIHESPKLGKSEDARLRSGMVLTVEPGVYREGFAGARIEDIVTVTSQGYQRLLPATPGLLIL
ncbi:MAG: M24 family metallopeptidase [Acidobacteria bacterium]|nr:M24 family metallopeptidase [Acidobacteriota bacterium]